ncbi:MAG: SgcJ/EcaC family oxidoreductase [Actinobacteria bacterium]|nr:SgcJ/EcaC family oxidoreductase [Actinomycetota bacterium]
MSRPDTAASLDLSALHARLVEAVERQDVEAIVSMYTADGLMLPPDGSVLRGSEAIRDFWKAAFAAGMRGTELRTSDVLPGGEDLVVEVGEASAFLAGDGGAPAEARNNYVIVHRRDAVGWLMEVDIWADLPADG